MGWEGLSGPDYAKVIGVAAALLTIGVPAFIKVHRFWRQWADRIGSLWAQFERALIVLNGRPAITRPEDGTEVDGPIPGVLERIRDLEKGQEFLTGEVHEIKNEVTHNGGGSLKDATKRTEEAVANIKSHLEDIDARLTHGSERFEVIERTLETQADANKAMWPAIEAIANATPPDGTDPDDGSGGS